MSADSLHEIEAYETAKRAYSAAMRDFFECTIHFSREPTASLLSEVRKRAEILQATFTNVNKQLAHLEHSYVLPQSVLSGRLVRLMEHGEHGRPTLEFIESSSSEQSVVRFGDWLRVRESSGEIVFEGFVSEDLAATVISTHSNEALAFGDHSPHVAREWFRRELRAEYSPGIVTERLLKLTHGAHSKASAT
ncbi:MAG TPA: hypothetical protein VGZ00_08340 [Candidatus Baltobacteraceae bacterium]|jgi:hypothetical protein|nr:hypothetical protein [Candidatus Baltobacteraceae bacterium]